MSKSTGETVDPLSLAEKYGSDAFRYFVMREMTVGNDAEFSLERFESRYRADLGNDLGNLLSRLLHMVASYEDGITPEVSLDEEPERRIRELWESTREETLSGFEKFRFNQGLDKTFSFVRGINKYADERTPWKLAKSEEAADRQALQTCLGTMIEALNKIDLLDPAEKSAVETRTIRGNDDIVAVSALTGDGCAAFLDLVSTRLSDGFEVLDVAIDPSDGRRLAWLYRHGEVIAREDTDLQINVTVRLSPIEAARFQREL